MATKSQAKPRVGLIGLGNTGRGLGRNLIDAGFPLAVFDVDREKVGELAGWGAQDAGTIAGLAAAAEIILTYLPGPPAVRAVYLGADGLVAQTAAGHVLVDCTTSDPLLTREIGAAARARGVHMVDAPLMRTPKFAMAGRLQVIVGGQAKDVARCEPVLRAFAEEVIHVGAIGDAHAIKIINNGVGLGTQALLCEAFNVARLLDIDLAVLHKVMQGGMAASRKLDDLAPRIINDDHSMSFALDLCIKDTTLFTELAKSMASPALIGDAVRNDYLLASRLGKGAANQSELATVLAEITSRETGTAN